MKRTSPVSPCLRRTHFLIRLHPSSFIRHPFCPAAFTLIELLVVLAVIGVLAAICVPVYGRVAESGRAAKCVSNLRQLGSALGLYLGEHNMTMPTLLAGRNDLTQDGAFIDNTLNAYTQGNMAVFACPSDGGQAARSGTSYYWDVALNGQPVSGLNFLNKYDQTKIVLLADKAAYHPYLSHKVNLLYADGHADKDIPDFHRAAVKRWMAFSRTASVYLQRSRLEKLDACGVEFSNAVRRTPSTARLVFVYNV